MYEAFFGLAERPFELTPNPRYLCLTPQHHEALATLRYGITSARGITLLVGEAGTGKTTLIRSAMALEAKDNARCVCLTNPTFSRSEFVQYIADQFGLSSEAGRSKMVLLKELAHTLKARRERGALTTFVIDEAQSLPYELLEEVRLLANLETADAKLLPVVLVGQLELAQRLNEPELRQLKQRIALRCTLTPLDLRGTASYISERLQVAGGSGATAFTREAVERIYEHSGGIPRIISVICDNALLAGFAAAQRPVTSRLVAEVCADFDLNRTVRETPTEPRSAASLSIPLATPDAARQPASAAQSPPHLATPTRELFETVGRQRRTLIF